MNKKSFKFPWPSYLKNTKRNKKFTGIAVKSFETGRVDIYGKLIKIWTISGNLNCVEDLVKLIGARGKQTAWDLTDLRLLETVNNFNLSFFMGDNDQETLYGNLKFSLEGKFSFGYPDKTFKIPLKITYKPNQPKDPSILVLAMAVEAFGALVDALIQSNREVEQKLKNFLRFGVNRLKTVRGLHGVS